MSSTETTLGAYAYWPENPFWSFQLLRLIEQANVGAADFSELHEVARELIAGDSEAWLEGFTQLAVRVQRTADGDAGAGHRVSAKRAYLRAANYHRTSGFFLSPADRRHHEAIRARRHCFAAAAELSEGEITGVEIPYEESALPGYLFEPVSSAPRRRPAAIVFGGTDAVAEEMYFFIGRSLTDRGFTVLALDGPGQGEALRRGLLGRPDWEVPVAAAVDFVSGLGHVDPQRIVLVGQSLGGYYAARAAAFEPRLRATVLWGALYDLFASLDQHAGATRTHFVEQFKRILGVEAEAEMFDAVRAFNLDGVAERIAAPVLIVHGESDLLVPVEQAHRTFEAIGAKDKELIVYPAGQPGCTHCQIDALALVERDITNWLERQAELV
jgi:alpha-beta hydrolase superfamily lysophospholipase